MGELIDATVVVGALAIAKPVIDTGCRLIEKLLGKPAEVAGEMLEDALYAWKWRNRILIAHQAQRMMDRNRIAATVLPPGFLVPLLDRAGDVDDPDLQQLWAQLLASGVSTSAARHPSFPIILSQLSRDEGVIFRTVFERNIRVVRLLRRVGDSDRFQFLQWEYLDFDPSQLHDPESLAWHLDHMGSLGICFFEKVTSDFVDSTRHELREKLDYKLNQVGNGFAHACFGTSSANNEGREQTDHGSDQK